MTEPQYQDQGAIFDKTRQYRYTLWRSWAPERGRILWVMLNPSTADENKLDPTLRRCLGFTARWGFGAFEICNLFAFRSTNPKVLFRKGAADPIGPENDNYIVEAAHRATRVIAGWGVLGYHMARGRQVLRLLEQSGITVECLDKTKYGLPKHPLYLKSHLKPMPLKEMKSF